MLVGAVLIAVVAIIALVRIELWRREAMRETVVPPRRAHRPNVRPAPAADVWSRLERLDREAA